MICRPFCSDDYLTRNELTTRELFSYWPGTVKGGWYCAFIFLIFYDNDERMPRQAGTDAPGALHHILSGAIFSETTLTGTTFWKDGERAENRVHARPVTVFGRSASGGDGDRPEIWTAQVRSEPGG